MYIKGIHEKGIYSASSPLRVFTNNVPDFDFPLHWHTALEIILVKKGSLTIRFSRSEGKLSEGEILVISPSELHGFNIKSMPGERFFIQFVPSAVKGIDMENTAPLKFQTFSIDSVSPYYLDLLEYLLSIEQEYEKKDNVSKFFINAGIFSLLGIFDLILATPEAVGITLYCQKSWCFSDSKCNRIITLGKLERVFEYISENYQNDIAMPDAANATGFSEYH